MLSVEGLSIDIGARRVVDGASFNAAPGEIIGLIGPNGAGKSTALKGIAALLPKQAGTVRVGGADVHAMPAQSRARAIAYLPQAREVYWPISAKHLVALGRFPHGQSAAADAPEVAAALAAVDATAFAERDVTTLSGGELARVLLARALALEAPLLLADEPVAALDPGHQLAAMNHLAKAAESGLTVVVVLHDLALAARFCHRLYLLEAGQITAAGTPDVVLESSALAAAFGARILRAEVGGVPLVGVENTPK